MTFDPRKISFRELLAVFWDGQPVNLPPGPDLRGALAVMPRGERQRRIAERSKEDLALERGETIYVDIVPDPEFWPAERLHQKFNLQRAYPRLVDELAAAFPSRDDFLLSTAAARLNAWLSPFGDEAGLAAAARELGLDVEELKHRLAEPER